MPIRVAICADLDNMPDPYDGQRWTATAWHEDEERADDVPREPPCTLMFRILPAFWDGRSDDVFAFFDASQEGETTFSRVRELVEEGELELDAFGLAYFDDLRTAPEHRGRGLATEVMRRVLDWLADHAKVTHGFLTAAEPGDHENDQKTQRLVQMYRRVGWRALGDTNSMMYDFEQVPRRELAAEIAAAQSGAVDAPPTAAGGATSAARQDA